MQAKTLLSVIIGSLLRMLPLCQNLVLNQIDMLCSFSFQELMQWLTCLLKPLAITAN